MQLISNNFSSYNHDSLQQIIQLSNLLIQPTNNDASSLIYQKALQILQQIATKKESRNVPDDPLTQKLLTIINQKIQKEINGLLSELEYLVVMQSLSGNGKSTNLAKQVCVQGYVSEAPLNAALRDASSTLAVNSQRLFTKECSAADGKAPSKEQALNTREHIPKQPLPTIFESDEEEQLAKNFEASLSINTQPQKKPKETPTEIVTKKLNLSKQEEESCQHLEEQIKSYCKNEKVTKLTHLSPTILAHIFSYLVSYHPLKLCYRTTIDELKTEELTKIEDAHALFKIICEETLLASIPDKTLKNPNKRISNSLQKELCQKVISLDARRLIIEPRSTDWLRNALRYYPNISSLFLPDMDLTTKTINVLSDFHKLSRLDISLCLKLGLIGLEKIHLKELSISNPYEARTYVYKNQEEDEKWCDEMAEKLPPFLRLTTPQRSLTEADFKTIGKIKTLEILNLGTISIPVDESAFIELGKLKNLNELYVMKADTLTARAIANWVMPKLKVLIMADCNKIDERALALISVQFPKLEELAFGGAAITDSALQHLKKLQKLKKLVMGSAPKITGIGLNAISHHPSLKTVSVYAPIGPARNIRFDIDNIRNMNFDDK